MRKLGADIVIDYTKEQPASVLSELDGAFDPVGGEALEQAPLCDRALPWPRNGQMPSKI